MMKKIEDYKNPFDIILEFENMLSEYTGAPYVVTTDCCSHAIELSFRYKQFIGEDLNNISFPARTYISVPHIFKILDIPYELINTEWYGQYKFYGTNIWDSARKLDRNMYLSGQIQCLSFGRTKPIEVGRGGAILLDDKTTYEWLIKSRFDGRDLSISPWENQKEWLVGYHYMMRPEECLRGLNILEEGDINHKYNHIYPDISKIPFFNE